MNVPTISKLPETVDENTVKMMRSLMSAMETPRLDLEKYPNRYVDNVMELIRTKAAGGTVEVKESVKAKPVSNLAEMLKASLAAKQIPAEVEL